MPIHTGQDKNGKFYQWGKTGKKYYFKPEDKQSKQRALNKAKKQQTAIYSSGWKGDKQTMKLIKVTKKDSNVLSKKTFGEVDVTINEHNGRIYAQFSVPMVGTSGELDDAKRGLGKIREREHELSHAISWAEAEIKKQSK